MPKTIFFLILLFAAFLRFFRLTEIPPSLYWDEVALGYNAYSIAESARDEHGRFLPIDYFLSFGDYKPPVYIYAAVPLIKIFGLSEWTTRFPSAFFGILSVALTFFLTRKLLSIYPILKNPHQRLVPYFAMLLMAISPWHLQTSRAAFEANIGQFLTTLAIYLFFVAFDKNRYRVIFFTLSSISFALTFYTFNSNRVFTPLIILLLTLLFFRKVFTAKNIFAITVATIVGSLMLTPLLPHLFSKEGQLRYREVNIFSDGEPVEIANARIARADNAWWASIFNNRRIYYLQNWLDGYFTHFKGDFLFLQGDANPRFSSGDLGQLYLATLPFMLIGIYLSIVRQSKAGYFLLGWVVLAPVPAAFAREVPHALRTLHILPTFDIFAAIGITAVISYTVSYYQTNPPKINYFLRTTAYLIAPAIFLFLQIFYFFYSYLQFYPQDYMAEWQYGYKAMVQQVAKLYPNYDRVIITNSLGRAYINVLFYQQYSPALYQQQRRTKIDDLGFGFVEVEGFDKYEFRGIDWKREIRDSESSEKILVVGVPSEVKQGRFTKSVIYDLKGQPVFVLNEVPQGVDAWTELGIYDTSTQYQIWHEQPTL